VNDPRPLDIVMPFYGRVDHFEAAVASVLAQTDPHWRLIVIDDVYPDRAPGEWVQAIGDPRITYLRNAKNLGVNGNFRKSLAMMTADYGVIVGCDDIMRPEYVARVRELSVRFPGAAIIQPGVETIDEDGRASRSLADRVKAAYRPRGAQPRELGGEFLVASLLRGNWAYFPSIAWNVSAAKAIGFRDDFEIVLDLALMLDLIVDGGTMVLDDRPVFDYRRHSASASSASAVDGTRFIEERDISLEMAALAQSRGWKRAARVARLHALSRLNALSVLPSAVRARDRAGIRAILAHVAGRR